MSKIRHLLLLLCATFLLLQAAALPGTMIPATGAADMGNNDARNMPELKAFIGQVWSGNGNQVTGLYAGGVFAYPVVQQPDGQAAFVSSQADKLTQFQMATTYGSIGFLAHNTLAGASFKAVRPGQIITVVYGDGRTADYQVMLIRRFQATQPNSPYSSFIDLSDQTELSAAQLFQQTYGVRDQLILQTCITMQGNDSWGRLFIIAIPYQPEPTNLH